MENPGQSGKQENLENLENRGMNPKRPLPFLDQGFGAFFFATFNDTRAPLESSRCRPQLRPQREELAAQALEIGPLPLLAPGLPECDAKMIACSTGSRIACACACACVCVLSSVQRRFFHLPRMK